ncbi:MULTISPECIES: phosphate regulon sensor histidine kinase PhoR [Nitrincola]|uniref:Phosphate regulon sensor protein PhoR n=1 Tax=Nitrincola nitratireducens TaxID=1229521 RepID=W9URG3_9GAMM|nr:MULTISPECIES: phosphate regulon sensor histidine kinase PhoR [Nitrincola]EXJ09684.1 Phosphate regulon sensor protein phoR [Nitrincola nitratireducens]
MVISKPKLFVSLFTFCVVGGLVGFVTEHFLLGLLLGSLSWSLYQLRQFQRLYAWAIKTDNSEPPDLPSSWGDLSYALYRLQRSNKEHETKLLSVIRRFQQSSAALEDAVVIIDARDKLEWWNRSAERLLGLKPKIDKKKSILNLLRDPRFIRYYKKQEYSEPFELMSPVHHQMTLQYHITRFGEGDRLLVARDITRLKQLEQTRQTFVANASHELRTPLTVIRGYLETFLDQELPKPIMRGLSQMQQQTLRMESLVSDLLLLSRLESSQHVKDEQPVNLPSLLYRIKRDGILLSGTKEHILTLNIASDKDLLGQPNELHSAFSNLVFNAVRYTPEGCEIKIEWRSDASGGHLSVIDNGRGIESHHIPHLTERFYRVDEGRSSETGGTGLGLSIVKHVLARHGAKLEIKSKLGVGSEFICHFPVDMLTDVEIEESEVDNNISHH